ncbi:DhnA family fructose-bisphosphate aldolase class Ia [Diaminobutyricimonas aerilata]|uniref:DhnA family fructose-bisphosphate aldolase class Ia n=1 Tax=Diaminobutyricimonas aerilata TaxID=1162967 RepID=A0A2M9CGJ0_9MICO|nr:deoxyribose-phosphate aldolase [Diaminobutyricimonas aerilata]PJJ71043.1 DhnA family fructose-bisphosphate aldolase class Ia [Diaminobutyricimonas aerilata]
MSDVDDLRRIRAEEPERIAEALRARRRRPLLTGDGRLFIVAADHPARGALGVGRRPAAMADRVDLLERLAVALERPGVDGVLGTPDIIDDLALLGVLSDKIVVGSMNRGGLQGASFEMDDRFTAYDVPAMTRDGIDAAKLLLRINLDDSGTATTLESAAAAVSRAADAGLPIILEPFMSRWEDGRICNDLTTEAVVKSIAIAAGLGNSSAYTWLKVPVVPGMERVAEASTMPTLLLGGDPVSGQDETFASWEQALALPGVRGLVVGRTLLYPEDDDVVGAVDTAAALVHAGAVVPHPRRS